MFVGPGQGQSVLCSATCAADVVLYTTATAGKVDDSSSGTIKIEGLKLTTATVAAATAPILATRRLATVS